MLDNNIYFAELVETTISDIKGRKKMGKMYIISSILMAALFVISASVQFNDPDWYFWIPLYTSAAYVNLMSCSTSLQSRRSTTVTGKIDLWLGKFLLGKVVLEDYFGDKVGIWSLDMTERVVREKIGSGLVIISMILQLRTASLDLQKRKKMEVGSHIEYGMATLVGISYGLSLVFIVYHEEKMKF